MKFPKELSLPVDHGRVNWPVMKEWVAKRVTELLGIEEEVLIGTIHNYLIDQRVGGWGRRRAGGCARFRGPNGTACHFQGGSPCGVAGTRHAVRVASPRMR
jgi:hypothetical protein